jgi:hypothetical protein
MTFVDASAPLHPDAVRTVNSGENGLFVTVETSYGKGAVNNDFTSFYVHFVGAGTAYKDRVLDGEYLERAKVIWLDRENVQICLPQGLTGTFHNEVTLGDPAHNRRVHVHLVERC